MSRRRRTMRRLYRELTRAELAASRAFGTLEYPRALQAMRDAERKVTSYREKIGELTRDWTVPPFGFPTLDDAGKGGLQPGEITFLRPTRIKTEFTYRMYRPPPSLYQQVLPVPSGALAAVRVAVHEALAEGEDVAGAARRIHSSLMDLDEDRGAGGGPFIRRRR